MTRNGTNPFTGGLNYTFRNPDLADTYREIARHGTDALFAAYLRKTR